jgi:glucose/arabinose dehydrogenase
MMQKACLVGMALAAAGAPFAGAECAAAAAPQLPPPFATPSAVIFSKMIGWPEDRTPQAPPGFTVSLYADGLDYPRWLYVLPNGDLLVSESRTEPDTLSGVTDAEALRGLKESGYLGKSANRITLLRDGDGDGRPELRKTLIDNLNQPFGMALVGDTLYVANTDAVLRFPYEAGQTEITAAGEKIVDLPAGGYNNHWTRNIVANAAGSKLYVSVGSATNVDEEGLDAKVPERAAILEINPDGSGKRIFANGLRNPNGMDWAPGTDVLWTAVNERDGLGDDLVPDYITSVRDGAFYGWPYAYFGANEDPRHAGKRPDLVAKAVVPDYPVGAHTASLGLVFYDGTAFPEKYRGGAFIGQHGSWNRSEFAGYKVLFVPFADGRPNGPAEDFLTGFIGNESTKEVYGRPCGVAVLPDGSLLVADDAGDRIWRVHAGS